MALKVALKICAATAPHPCTETPRLVTIGFSHYCEKARWALDMSPLRYYESIHSPALHLSETNLSLSKLPRLKSWIGDGFDRMRESQSASIDPKTLRQKERNSVPKLVLPKNFLLVNNLTSAVVGDSSSGAVVAEGSAGILMFLSKLYPSEMGHLYPAAIYQQVIELESYLERTLGVYATAWAFGNILLMGSAYESKGAGGESINMESFKIFLKKSVVDHQSVPFAERLLARGFGGFFAHMMAASNGVTAERREIALMKIKEVLTEMDLRIAPLADSSSSNIKSKTFLFNTDRPTAADITLAALSFPILLPLQCSSLFATAKFMSEQDVVLAAGCRRMADVAKQLLEEHRSARYALYLYDTYRFFSSQHPLLSGSSSITSTATHTSTSHSSDRVVIPKPRK